MIDICFHVPRPEEQNNRDFKIVVDSDNVFVCDNYKDILQHYFVETETRKRECKKETHGNECFIYDPRLSSNVINTREDFLEYLKKYG